MLLFYLLPFNVLQVLFCFFFLVVLLCVDDLSCSAFKRYVFFYFIFSFFLRYSKAQLSTVADLLSLFTRARARQSGAHPRSRVSFDVRVCTPRACLRGVGMCECNARVSCLCVCGYLILMVSTSPLIFVLNCSFLKLFCEYINVFFPNQSK